MAAVVLPAAGNPDITMTTDAIEDRSGELMGLVVRNKTT